MHNSKKARKFELPISDQTLEDLLLGNSCFQPDVAVLMVFQVEAPLVKSDFWFTLKLFLKFIIKDALSP